MIDSGLKDRIFNILINCQISTYTSLYAPNEAVIPISNILSLLGDGTKYSVRKCLKSLMQDGVICYKSMGCPAVVSYGEIPELVYDAAPPINGYTLTKKGIKHLNGRTHTRNGRSQWKNGRQIKNGR